MQKYDAEWFEAVLDAMHDMVLVKGPESRLLWANKAFRDLYGMSVEELHQIIDAEHSDPDDTLQYVIDDRTVFDSARPLDVPQEVVTDPGGNSHLFHTIKSPILDGGEVVRTVGVSRRKEENSISRRQTDHHDAKAFAAPLAALMKWFSNPMLMVDLTGRILKTNPVWIETFGDPGESPNTTFSQAYGTMEEVAEKLEASLRAKTTEHIAMELPDSIGARKQFSVSINPWGFADGVLGGATIVATDVSELFHQTEALQRANDELIQFSYRASHDLKGPLSTMKGLAQFITEDIRDGEIDEALESARQIVATAERLEHTVISILDLARADLKDNPLETFDLSEMIDETCSGFSALLAQSDVRVIKELHVHQISSQAIRVRQIIENLISNAIKYRSDDKQDRFVRITAMQVGEWLELRVADNGLGIPETEQTQIFDLFSRFNTQQEGAGLGLSIVDKHVKALSGSISVSSNTDGTEFCVTLPNLLIDRLAS